MLTLYLGPTVQGRSFVGRCDGAKVEPTDDSAIIVLSGAFMRTDPQYVTEANPLGITATSDGKALATIRLTPDESTAILAHHGVTLSPSRHVADASAEAWAAVVSAWRHADDMAPVMYVRPIGAATDSSDPTVAALLTLGAVPKPRKARAR